MYLNVSNIQHFSVSDGPGIRSTLFLKGCNLHCPWCHNPETISQDPQILIYKNTKKAIKYGTQMTVEEAAEAVYKDIEFYNQSGGGVTVSGGEPLLQADAVSELLKLLHMKNVHTLVDTAGAVPFPSFEKVLPYTDCFFFDWKSPSPETYKNVIGGELELIEDNLYKIAKIGKKIHVRIPIIPNINDKPSDIEQTTKKLKNIGIKKIDLLPFHRLASGKYEALGIKYAYSKVTPPSAEHIKKIAELYGKNFIVTIED